MSPFHAFSRLLPLLLLLLGLSVRCQEDIVADFSDAVLAAAVEQQGLEVSTELGRIESSDLPVTRPPYHTPQGWKLCHYSCATNISVRTGSATKGVLELDISYKPIPGVNSSMMVWMFEHLNGSVRYSVNNKTYPMYLIFHPVDHMFHKLSSRPITVGTRLTWCEIALTGCRYNAQSATAPYVCPPRRRGYTRSSPEQQWNGPYQSKVEMIVSWFDRSSKGGIEFYSSRSVAGTTRVVGGVRHSWQDSNRGLLLQTFQWVGLMKPGSIREFDDSAVGTFAKGPITRALLGGDTPATNIKDSNMTQLGWLSALHFLQEYWGVGAWLPQVYAGRNS